MAETTGFYNRTAFRVLNEPLPTFFASLDQYIAEKFPVLLKAWSSKEFEHAENICRRNGDILLIQKHLEEALARPNRPEGAALGASYMTFYFSCVKSLLDSIAIMLNDVYSLGLTGGDLDLAKDQFWNKFVSLRKTEAGRYGKLRPWFREARDWRDAAIHRVAPILSTAGPGHPNKVDPSLTTVVMVDQRDVKASDLMVANPAFWQKLISPLDLLAGWRPSIALVTELACEDIRSA
ncbi:MAG: hypothetical protein ACYDAB_12600 [bacterium]